MSESVKHKILQLLQETSQFNSDDVLVNLMGRDLLEFTEKTESHSQIRAFPFTYPQVKTILTRATKTKKEQGIYPLCLTKGFIEWIYKQKTVRSPLLLIPCQAEVSKINDSVKIIPLEEDAFFNPFVLNRLNSEFGISINLDVDSAEKFSDFLKLNGFDSCDSEHSFLGNFHHHRFEIIKELEELSSLVPNSSLSQLLGDESQKDATTLKLDNSLLFPSDVDQLEVYQELQKENIVVQGPPGTGKSQVLSSLIAKLLIDNKSAIVVSEKRVALEVIKKKLGEFNLDHLCFIASSETISKEVLSSLKSTWAQLENYTPDKKNELHLSEQYTDQLQMQLNLLNTDSLIGGLSFAEFQDFSKDLSYLDEEYLSDLPALKDWIKSSKAVSSLFEKGISFYVGNFNSGSYKLDSFKLLDQTIRTSLRSIENAKKSFILETWSDLLRAMKKAALCQNFDNAHFRKFEAVLTPNSKEQKKFLRLRKKYLQLQIVHHNFELEKTNWKYFPSQSEVENLLELNKDTSYISKWKFKKKWAKISRIPAEHANESLHKWKQYLVASDSISQINIDFCEIGLCDVKSELESVYQQIHHYSPEERLEWLQIPHDQRKVFAEFNKELNQLYTQLKLHFRWDEETNMELFLSGILQNADTILRQLESIKTLDDAILRNLRKFTRFDQMEAAVCKSNWVKFTSQFPVFSQFQTTDLLEKSHTIIVEQDKEAKQFAGSILLKQHQKFNYYHKLLQTSSTKLNDQEKELKATLKKGKSILVKEFSKSRNYPSLRELFASEAKVWIQLLKPIWLSNPTQIAKCFPMQHHLFDVAIFDEASQIPLHNSLGAIQRSKRILVAGDQQQMGPSSYFKSSNTEIVDLLHQAGFYWKNVRLKHHYRSEHPALIQFSNKHFYENELEAYPSLKQEKQPLDWHYCEGATFIDRKNKEEAKHVAKFIEESLSSKNHLGIVAFSETQLNEIYSSLSPAAQEKLESRIENDTLFFKALENVQGEECDHLIISLGYGKNENGEFHMRFGPLNTKNGTKRLNVLFTRARQKIDFFSSVKANDFKIHSNEAINLLRLYLLQLQNIQTEEIEPVFPYDLDPIIHGKKATFRQIFTSVRDAKELVTLVRVLESRGWNVELE